MAKNKKNKGGSTRSGVRLVALILCLLLAGGAIVGALISVFAYAETEEPMAVITAVGSGQNNTEITLSMEEGAQFLCAFQISAYTNTSDTSIDQILFSIGANSLRRISTIPYSISDLKEVYPSGFQVGGVQIESVQINGKDARWGIQGESEEFLRISCHLEPGEGAQFQMRYTIMLPEMTGFFGKGLTGIRLTRCFPIPCMMEPDSLEYTKIRQNVFTQCYYYPRQDVIIHVQAPETYTVEAYGTVHRESPVNGICTTTIWQRGVPDIALGISRRLTEYTKTLELKSARQENGDTFGYDINSASTMEAASVSASDSTLPLQKPGVFTLTCHANSRHAAGRVLNALSKILTVYTENLGEYPLENLSVVQADLPSGDKTLVYPGLIFVNRELLFSGQGHNLESALAEAVARQWFGIGVQNNPETASWLSDSICSYTSFLYQEKQYGHNEFLKQLNARVIDSLNITIPGNYTLDSACSEFTSPNVYDCIVRERGTVVLHELRQVMGENVFWQALSIFYQDNTGKTVTKQNFLDALQKATGKDMTQALEYNILHIADYVEQRPQWLE